MAKDENIKQLEQEFQIIQKQCLLNSFYKQKARQRGISFCESMLSKCLFLMLDVLKKDEAQVEEAIVAKEFQTAFFLGYRGTDFQKQQFEYPLDKEKSFFLANLEKRNRIIYHEKNSEIKMDKMCTVGEVYSFFKNIQLILGKNYSYPIMVQKIEKLFISIGISLDLGN